MNPQTELDEDALAGLRQQLAGSVLLAADPGYDEARRVWNAMIDRRPAVIVRAGAESDIAPAVRFALGQGLPIAVRGGGHNVAGNGTVDAGVVLDLGGLRNVEVDPDRRTVRVQPGATLADLDAATTAHGLAVPTGVVSSTGVAGLTLGGGFGWLTRADGLAADNLVSVELVTAGGHPATASDTENPDLFWGLRGGGGNFGVATSFTFRARPLPSEVFSGNLVYYGPEHWTIALQAWEHWTRELPDELTSIITVIVPPPSWELGDEPALIIGFCWASEDRGEGERLVDALRQAAPPDAEAVEPVPWVQWQSQTDELFPKGVRAYWKNTSFDRLDDEVIALIIGRAAEQTWHGTAFDIHHLGGAFGRVPEEATAFPNRSARFWLNVYGFWNDAADDAARINFVRGFATDMRPFATGGQYINFMGAEPGQDPRSLALTVYGPDKLERLTALKRAWDPDNAFRLNHNIQPAPA
ncbi:FAD-binding oxidoreductase [Arthrobacter mobilis]|uniref:FAD-binding oxidoreductase n=1 Tax=Arthrobacter mobilis TaxID=2724944 RepID=A0A7X6K3S6_9MICC|nr:FAD-binding oxidoreductase [Arthrobacter mobilis]NKX54622.1 FAD-binding oxidoreductase [Arthrobacter mobilis]